MSMVNKHAKSQKITWVYKLKTKVLKLGFWGFLFFLVKGLLWLIIPYIAAQNV